MATKKQFDKRTINQFIYANVYKNMAITPKFAEKLLEVKTANKN